MRFDSPGNRARSSGKDAIRKKDEALLATLGYKQEFKRAFKPLEVFGIAFSIIGILPSIASVLFFSVPYGGGPAMIWGWLVASVLILSVAISVAELGSAAPTSGGLYFWTYSLSSPKWRNVLCWTVGYSNTIGGIAGVASIDWGCAVQIMAAVTIGSNGTFSPTSAQLFGVFTAVVISHAFLCCLGTAVLARLQGFYIALNLLLCLGIIIALPAATPQEFKNSAKMALWEFQNVSGWPNGYAFIMSMLAPLWTIGGFDAAVHISEEAANAVIAVPWAIVSSTAISGVLGLAINMALAFCMGGDLGSLLDSGQPMAQIFHNSFGRRTTLAIWTFVVITQYMMGSSLLLAASRQTFAFSRDSALPFSRWLYRMNSYTRTPVNTVWFDALLAIALGALVFAGPQAVNAVFSLSVIGQYYAYSTPIAARFLGDNQFKPGPFNCGALSLPIAVVAVLFMGLMSVVFMFPAMPGTGAGDMNYTIAVFGGGMILSLVYYYFPVVGGRHWFVGPIANIGPGTDSESESYDGEKKDDIHSQTVEVNP